MIHKIVVVLDVEAESYDNAVNNLDLHTLILDLDDMIINLTSIKNISIEHNFEHDEEGQRVLRLPPEEKLSEEQLLTNRYFSLADSNSVAEDEERNEIIEKLGYTPAKDEELCSHGLEHCTIHTKED